jgi:hypothetical protein
LNGLFWLTVEVNLFTVVSGEGDVMGHCIFPLKKKDLSDFKNLKGLAG